MIRPMPRPTGLVMLACWFAVAARAVADDPRVIQPPSVALDPAQIYRFDPLLETFSPIEPSAIKPFHVYHRFSPILGTWVWSKATADRRLEFALGPGSVQQAFLFDFTATMEERRRVLEKRAPDIARLYAIQGARAAVMLEADGKWRLHGVQSLGHVYDLETGHRWEWHGDHRAGVTHGGGNAWVWHDGAYLPAHGGGRFIDGCVCSEH